ncbi:unnamed protein product [Dovyalis caffra]|uniref:RING-type E3 ubiquitin transferase n=1 Tax=Dovyalis caffra TaxID=77055 RepID=A0AAV1RNB1_9ROSI|nr:unnamed protein product [Dovyalis caffra]
MEDFGDLRFHLTPLDIVKPGDDCMACDKFCIEVEASFMPPILDEDDLSDYESQLFDVECEWKEEDFLVDRDRLLNDDQEVSRSIIRDILGDMNIPVRAFMIDRILACARQMAVDNIYLSHKVLYMRVRIDVPPGFESSEDDIIEGEINLVPASKSSVEALEIVKVEEEGYVKQPCAVCFEELLMGGEATRLPCSHVYHCGCIRKWLEKSKFCPLCRFEIS